MSRIVVPAPDAAAVERIRNSPDPDAAWIQEAKQREAVMTTPTFLQPRVPTQCPVCGAHSLAPEVHVSVLLAVCDVLVTKALESMGKFIVRAERSRHAAFGKQPWYLAHTMWQPTDAIVDKALRGAWDVVPVLLDTHDTCCDFSPTLVTHMLDEYVHDLVITGTPHSIDELAYRMQTRLDLPVVNHA